MDPTPFPRQAAEAEFRRMRGVAPLVHCMTNEVVQEITANVLLAAGASPAMVVGDGEAPGFARVAGALLINIGTPYEPRLGVMRAAARAANEAGTPWVLDPVAAGGMPWRDAIIREFLAMGPTVVRGNASEILALAGMGAGGKGVDSTDSSAAALPAATVLARQFRTVVCVTGKTDFVTDGARTLAVDGGDAMTTLVVGTGCSLSALAAAFSAGAPDLPTAIAGACAMAKRASELARSRSRGPGSFAVEYLDALYQLGR